MSSPETHIPATRSLVAVLRRELAGEPARATLFVARVTATPNPQHVTVEVHGSAVTIPKLASYQPVAVGDACYCLSAGALVLALGTVK